MQSLKAGTFPNPPLLPALRKGLGSVAGRAANGHRTEWSAMLTGSKDKNNIGGGKILLRLFLDI